MPLGRCSELITQTRPARPETGAVVSAEGLTKRYGSRRGVEGLTFAVPRGEVFGFLGPNGAGKTTTIRLMLDLIRPTAGSVEVFGLHSRRDSLAIRRRIGYLPGDLRLYERWTGEELLAYFARLHRLRGPGEAPRLAQALEIDLSVPIRALSRGNRQKVGLVQAMMHRPDLLVLDEPTSGLDPLVQQTFYELLEETTGDGRTVFLSSHVLSEVQRVADRVAIVREGRLELVETVERLRRRAFTRVEATFRVVPGPDAFAGTAGVRVLDRHGVVVVFALEGPIDPLLKQLARFEVLALDVHEADLEDIFLALYRGVHRAG
jgi:beta-exotoxin I transport system ATP-binding protein